MCDAQHGRLERKLQEGGAYERTIHKPIEREQTIQEALHDLAIAGELGADDGAPRNGSRICSWNDYRRLILSVAQPRRIDRAWEKRRTGRRSFLMICHDQHIDRRILHQAEALSDAGWVGKIVALSPDSQDHLEGGMELSIHRIGLVRIISDCPLYWRYLRRQRHLLRWRWAGFRPLWKANWYLYRLHMKARYGSCRGFDYPFPFDNAFRAAGANYPADIVVAHDLTALPVAHELATRWGVPLVYDSHELYEEQCVFSRVQRQLIRAAEERLIRQSTAVITVNHSIADELARRYGCSRPHVILNVMDPPRDFDPTDRHRLLHEHFQLPEKTPIVLFQGGLWPRRNLPFLLQVLRCSPPDSFVLVFMGCGPLRRKLADLVSRYGLEHRAYFKDDVPWTDLLPWTASADLGIIPYPPVDLNALWCTPNKLFEYIQAAVPIVANDLPELRRYTAETGFGETAAMEDPPVVADVIIRLLAAPRRRRRMRDAMLARRHEFSWSRFRDTYLSIIDGALKAQ